MELKNALAVCLISLFSATLVVLIARSLDSQAASRIEPQLARIVEQLEAIRTSGGISLGTEAAPSPGSPVDGVVVYYFHGNVRCPTCRSIEAQAHAVVQQDFADDIKSGDLSWKILNYEEADGARLGARFEVQMPVLVIARIENGKVAQWKRLDAVWALVGDEPAFAEYVRDEIGGMLDATETSSEVSPPRDDESVVQPAEESDALPLPTGPSLIPNP